jgi:hypothetical protein
VRADPTSFFAPTRRTGVFWRCGGLHRGRAQRAPNPAGPQSNVRARHIPKSPLLRRFVVTRRRSKRHLPFAVNAFVAPDDTLERTPESLETEARHPAIAEAIAVDEVAVSGVVVVVRA